MTNMRYPPPSSVRTDTHVDLERPLMTDRSSLSTDPTAEILSEMRWFRAVPKRTCTLRWLAPWFSVSDYITSGEVTQGIQGLRLLEPAATVRHLRLIKIRKTEENRDDSNKWTLNETLLSSSKDVASIVSQLSGNLFVSHSWYTDSGVTTPFVPFVSRRRWLCYNHHAPDWLGVWWSFLILWSLYILRLYMYLNLCCVCIRICICICGWSLVVRGRCSFMIIRSTLFAEAARSQECYTGTSWRGGSSHQSVTECYREEGSSHHTFDR